MSMAINRVSAAGVAAMLYPVTKPSRLAKVGSGRTSSASRADAQSTSRPQPAEASSPEQVHAAFQYAQAALGNMAAMSSTSMPQASPVDQSGGIQQAGSAYAQVEQQAGQALDLTA
jgi:hypothetical protein